MTEHARFLSGLHVDFARMEAGELMLDRIAKQMPHLTPEQHEYIARERKLLRSGIEQARQLGAAAEAAHRDFMSNPPDEIKRMLVPQQYIADSIDRLIARPTLMEALDAAGNNDGVFYYADTDDDDREGE